MTDVLVEEATVRFGVQLAVDELSLAVGSGEIVAVVGPSGSGKSTLLRVIAGLQPLHDGRVLIGGEDVSGVPTHRRDLGLMFQDHALFAHLSVVANVEYGLKFSSRSMSRSQRNRRAVELLDMVGLGAYQDRRVGSLSGGEAQRVALARALAPKPGLLMLDEPLGSLDRPLRVQLIDDLARVLRDVGQTALYVTHDQTEAFGLADRIAVMDHGQLLAVDRPAELWARPNSEFVATFLGHRNIWTVDISSTGEVRWNGYALGSIPDSMEMPVGSVRVVTPVPALSIVPEADRSASAALVTIVDRVEFDQGVYRVRAGVVARGDDTAAAQNRAWVYLDSRQPVVAGDRLLVAVDLAQLCVLELIHEP